MTKVLSFGDRIAPGRYEVLSRFDRAVNLAGPGLVGLVTPAVSGGPINIVMEGADLTRVEVLVVRREDILLDGVPFPKSPLYDSSLPAGRPDPSRLKELLLRKAHPKSLAFLLDFRRGAAFSSGFEKALAQRLRGAAEALRRGELETGAREARGAGFGLTPSGDDLLAGYLWGLHLRQRACGGDLSLDIARVYAAGKGANPLSSAFLDCAREGRFFQPLKELLAQTSEDRLDAVLAAGETSGADVCVGVLLALEKEASLWS